MTTFSKGDVVESTVTAQGLTAGLRYIVVAKQEMATAFGTFTTLLLVRSIADAPIPVSNGHLVLKPAFPTAAGEIPAATITPEGAAVAAFSLAKDASRAAAEQAALTARPAKPGRKARAERKAAREPKTDEEKRAKFRMYTAKSRAKKALADGAPKEQAMEILQHGGWSPDGAKEALADLLGKPAEKAAPAPKAAPRRSLRRGEAEHTAPRDPVAPVAAQQQVKLEALRAETGDARLDSVDVTPPAPEPSTEPTAASPVLAAVAEKGYATHADRAEPKPDPVVALDDEALAERVAAMLASDPKTKSADVVKACRVSANRAMAALAEAKRAAAAKAPAPTPTPALPESLTAMHEAVRATSQVAPPEERMARAAAAKEKLAQMMAKPKAQA